MDDDDDDEVKPQLISQTVRVIRRLCEWNDGTWPCLWTHARLLDAATSTEHRLHRYIQYYTLEQICEYNPRVFCGEFSVF